jgi:hypothetical protein
LGKKTPKQEPKEEHKVEITELPPKTDKEFEKEFAFPQENLLRS